MGLGRRKPFTFLAAVIAIVLLVLACTTKQNACYEQVGILGYAKIDDDASTWCADQCSNDVASKKIAYVTGVGTTETLPGADYASSTPNLRRVIRCSWSGTTGRLFLACACLMVVWVALELLLAAKRKYPFILNIILILVIGLGVPTAIYQLNDIHDRTCSDITTPTTFATQTTLCYQSLYNVSFILTIVAMVLLLAQLLYNIVRRKAINEEDPKYAGIPQATNPTHDNVAPVVNPDAERLQ
jgi:hypothetical protein